MRSDLENLIIETAGRLHRRYRRFTDVEDLQQEMWLWALGRPKYVTGLSTGTLKRRLYVAGEAYARREKAAKSGYEPDDEHYYSLTVLRELLPLALEVTGPVLRGVDDRDGKAARRSAAGPGMELETALADVRRAYSGLSGVEQLAVSSYVMGDGDSLLVDRALRKMQRALGGRKPRREAA